MTEKNSTHLSKLLSRILRHDATTLHLNISPDGFVLLEDILQLPQLKARYSIEDVDSVVKNSEKQRFSLSTISGNLYIKANQGHSLSCVKDLDLVPILSSVGHETIIHGTYFRCWKTIQTQGLSRMSRNHIHFAVGLPSDKHVISGMRQSCQVFIYINLELALQSGLLFFKSPNNVVLSPGDERGYILPKFFLKVCTKNGQLLKVD